MKQIITDNPFVGFVETRIGGRNENQDNAGWADTPYGLLVMVCDGMGGGPGGKTASATVVDVVNREMLQCDTENPSVIACEKALTKAIIKANEVLKQMMVVNPDLQGMGTTIAAVVFHSEYAVVAHVGDSRVYKIRPVFSKLNLFEKVFRTKDHSYVGELVGKGLLTEEQARLSANTNVITRAIGANSSSEPDIDTVTYEKHDRFLICSDGVCGTMPEKDLIKLGCLSRPLSIVVERIANIVDQLGLKNGGHYDNLTVALVEAKSDSKDKEKMNKKARWTIMGMIGLLLLSLIIIICLLFKNGSSSSLKDELISAREDVSLLEKRLSQVSSSKDSLQKCVQSLSIENDELRQKIGSSKGALNKKVQDKTPNTSSDKTTFAPEANELRKMLEDIKKILEGVNKEYNAQADCAKAVKSAQDKILGLISGFKKEQLNPEESKMIDFIESQIKGDGGKTWDQCVNEKITGNKKKYILDPKKFEVLARIKDNLNKL